MIAVESLRRWMLLGVRWRVVDFIICHNPLGEAYRRIRTTRPVVALTYDDGPNPPYTLDLLDVLDQHRVKATFFMLGRNLEAFPQVAAAVLARGHEVGNHSYSHPLLLFRTLSFIRNEIEATDSLLRQAGATGEIYFRSPHGAHLFGVPYVLAKARRKNILFDFVVEDWLHQANPAAIVQRVVAMCVPGSIIALHDGGGVRAGTVAATELIIKELRRRGYEFASVKEMLTDATT